MKKYEEYRAVKLGWVDEVPAHWVVKKLKHVAGLNSGESIIAETINPEGPYPVYGGNGLRGYTDSMTHDGHYVLIGRQGHLCGNINYAQGTFFASEHALVATPKVEFETTWLGELLRSMNLGQYSQAAAQPGLSADRIQNLNIPIPPLPEQRAIAAYLDRKTAQLDTLLAQKEALLQMLHQKRQALINEAVTQGLDPAAPRKPSGVEWLGDVPAHWEVKKLKQVAENVQTGFTPPTDEPKFYEEGTIDWFAPSDFGDHVVLRNAKKRITSLAIESGNARSFKPQTVLLIGIGATLGKVGICETTCSANQQINAISFKDNYNPYFATYYLKAINQIIVNSANASTMPILNQTGTKELYCICPPLAEQQVIVDFIEARIGKINAATAAIHTQIKTLKAYRQSLISEVVTGKVDVRTAEAVAPEADLPLWRQ